MEEYILEEYISRYSVIVTFSNGHHRGYMVEAEDMDEMMQKLMNRISAFYNTNTIHNICISEILMDEDIVK